MHQTSVETGVNILDPKQLLAFAQNKTEAGRSQFAGAVARFFDETVMSDVQRQLAGDVLLDLVRQAERDLRQALAERLAVQDNVPAELIVLLANDEISIAEPVLLHSKLLKDIDLMYIIATRSNEHWRAVARRESLSPMVTDRLIDTDDTVTALRLLENGNVRLQKGSMKKMVRAALRAEELQLPLLRRPEVTPDVAVDIYMVVSFGVRKLVAEKFSIQAHLVEQAVEALVHELNQESRGQTLVTQDMMALAERFHERGDIAPDLMIRTLRRGQTGFFVALFAARVGLATDRIVEMIQKDGGKPFVVACRSIGMMKSEFATIFLLSRGIRTGDKIVDQRELAMALKYFDALKDFDAQRYMAAWKKSPEMILRDVR